MQELVRRRGDVTLLAPNAVLRRTSIGGLRVDQIGSATGHLWEQTVLPRHLRTRGSPLLLSLANTGPVSYPNQAIVLHDVSFRRIPEAYTMRFRLAYGLLLPLITRRARKIITVSEFSRREISQVLRVSPEDIAVVPNAAGIEPSSPPSFTQAIQAPYYLAVASQAPHKNIDFLLRAFEHYRASSGSPIRLKLVGGDSPSFVVSSTRARVVDGVDMLGRVTDTELATLYAGAHAFLFPSLYEGFGIPPIEAQAFGCPVASSNAGSLPEVLGKSARFFDPTSEIDLIEALRDLDRDSDLRDRLRDAGFENRARFSWEESAGQMSSILDGLLADA